MMFKKIKFLSNLQLILAKKENQLKSHYKPIPQQMFCNKDFFSVTGTQGHFLFSQINQMISAVHRYSLVFGFHFVWINYHSDVNVILLLM